MTKKREVYNEIKYGLCELFPTEHGNFMINNSDCSFTYSKFSDSGKILFYGEMSIGDKIEFSVFRTREDYPDCIVFYFSWMNVSEMKRDVQKTEEWLGILNNGFEHEKTNRVF